MCGTIGKMKVQPMSVDLKENNKNLFSLYQILKLGNYNLRGIYWDMTSFI